MRTDELIRVLAADTRITRHRPTTGRLMLAVALTAALVCLVVAGVIGIRPDLQLALLTPPVLFKFGISLALAWSAFSSVRQVATPEGKIRPAPFVVSALLLVGGVAFELTTTAPTQWTQLTMGETPLTCMSLIVLLALIPLTGILLTLRPGAASSPERAGATAGCLASGLSAFVYALHCPIDSALFVAVWYVAAVLAGTGIGWVAGRRILAW